MTVTDPGLTGRITAPPSELLHEQVLAPQFAAEVSYLLEHYLHIEKVLLVEYLRMGLLTRAEAERIGRLLHGLSADALTADPAANMSDIAFAIERHVTAGMAELPAAWHVDRSRNDLQACAQLLAGRDMVHAVAAALIEFGTQAHRLASTTSTLPMPGYTHLQAAQVISPGFYLAAVSGQAVRTLDRLAAVYQAADSSPLGSGAMSGQDLAWDRDRMAALLGCGQVQPHALTGVANRGWALEAAAELSTLGITLSRFATDLMAWGSSAYGFIDLPDELCGISSAMPQKKNFPVLERIRGRTAHLTAFYLDLALGQRNTPFSNMVEVSKEAGTHLRTLFGTAGSVLDLFGTVLANLRFLPDRMREACEREYLGGFALANALTLHCGVPWRSAQVIAGEYIVAALDRGLPPSTPDSSLLASVAAGHGQPGDLPADVLREAFDVDHSLTAKRTKGSANPDAVHALLVEQATALAAHRDAWQERADARRNGRIETDELLGLGGPRS
jgi:argininosuccinate lyase